MLQIMPSLLSLSLIVSSSSPTATALTDQMSESVPFFFCSDFREETTGPQCLAPTTRVNQTTIWLMD